MKLLTRTNLNFLSISLFIFLIGLIIFYYLLRKQVDANINTALVQKEMNILSNLKKAHGTQEAATAFENKISILPITDRSENYRAFSDTVLFNPETETYNAYRQLKFNTSINDQYYQVTIYKSLAETDTLIVRILLLVTGVVVALILVLLILNQHTTRKAWQGFYNTLHQINSYDLNSQNEFELKKTDIDEFDELNRVLMAMNERIRKDYHNLKEYTENASHELQTPLAIIASKLELLLQSENLPEKELQTITDALEASSKLSRLNNTLLLLAKIENRQFPVVSDVELLEIIESHLSNFEELIETRKISVSLPTESQTVKMNRYLAEVMVANLIKNAIRHNVRGGVLKVELDADRLTVANSGDKIAGDEDQLFQRFYKATGSGKSTGLGLAIVQKICEISGFQIRYQFKNDLHCFNVFLKNDSE